MVEFRVLGVQALGFRVWGFDFRASGVGGILLLL